MFKQRRVILLVIVLAQFFCTSLWFAGNAVMAELIRDFALPQAATGLLTSAVQLGFIGGTLVFAFLALVDRFSPSRVFMLSALLGATANLALLFLPGKGIYGLLLLRCLTGFFLAGIYPVGMKIAADYFDKALAKSLGWLVGALVLGTAFPHLLKALGAQLHWSLVFQTTSGMAISGGLLIGLGLPDGPHRKAGQKVNLLKMAKVFHSLKFRKAAFGYFGHMWELYAFWTFLPFLLSSFIEAPQGTVNNALFSFSIIAFGAIACVLAGLLAQRVGPQKIALLALSISGTCALLLPVFAVFRANIADVVFLLYLFIWGFAVIADSALFSSLVASNAKAEIKGTALTIVTCIGFAITIVSIQVLSYFSALLGIWVLGLLALGPVLGLLYHWLSRE